jgi:hypothetical protein
LLKENDIITIQDFVEYSKAALLRKIPDLKKSGLREVNAMFMWSRVPYDLYR